MADRTLDEAPKVTDMAYVPVIMTDGSIGQIAKADLASVVAEQINPLKIHSEITEGDLNNYMFNGVSYMNPSTAESIINAPINAPYGMLFSLNLYSSAFQLCILYDIRVFFRAYWGGSWSDWAIL